jgi:Uncharacterised nucleotidyltransferase
MNLYKEKLQLLKYCLSESPPEWSQILKLFESADTYTQFLDDQGVLAILHHHLTTTIHNWPAHVIANIEKLAAKECIVDKVRQNEVSTIFQSICDRKIPCLVIKGESLSRYYYDQPYLRSRIDIDLWVDSIQFDSVAAIFFQNGYTELPSLKIHNERVFKKTNALGVDTIFDLHTKISNRSFFASLIPFAEAWGNSLPLDNNSHTLRRLNSAYELMLSCLHPIFHHANWGRYIWFLDTKLIIDNIGPKDTQQFFDILRNKKISDLCRHYIETANKHCPIDNGKISFLSEFSKQPRDFSDKHIAKYQNWWGLILQDFKLQKNLKEKTTYLQQILLPDVDYMSQKYGLKSGKFFALQLIAAYILRVTNGVMRKILIGSQS